MEMTIDEAIKHCEEVANANERLCETVHPAMQLSDYGKCASEHRQLATWLKELKERKSKCKWIKYDYRTIRPKECGGENPYWRIPENRMDALKYCPYCGKEIEVEE